jgi:hypothetical protein
MEFSSLLRGPNDRVFIVLAKYLRFEDEVRLSSIQ